MEFLSTSDFRYQLTGFSAAQHKRLFSKDDEEYKDKGERGLTRSECLWSIFHGNKAAMEEAINDGDFFQDISPHHRSAKSRIDNRIVAAKTE